MNRERTGARSAMSAGIYDPSRARLSRIASVGERLSLTPALSRWERERVSLRRERSPDGTPSPALEKILPLPAGEGQGEGELFPALDKSAYRAYASIVAIQKKVLNVSLRSATQATDSTCKGCHPNSAATNALRQRAPVIRRRAANSSTVLPTCNNTPLRWWPQGRRPYSSQSSM